MHTPCSIFFKGRAPNSPAPPRPQLLNRIFYFVNALFLIPGRFAVKEYLGEIPAKLGILKRKLAQSPMGFPARRIELIDKLLTHSHIANIPVLFHGIGNPRHKAIEPMIGLIDRGLCVGQLLVDGYLLQEYGFPFIVQRLKAWQINGRERLLVYLREAVENLPERAKYACPISDNAKSHGRQ